MVTPYVFPATIVPTGETSVGNDQPPVNNYYDFIANDTQPVNNYYDFIANDTQPVNINVFLFEFPPAASLECDHTAKGNGKSETKVDTKTDTKIDTKVDTKTDTKTDTKVDTKTDTKIDTKTDATTLDLLKTMFASMMQMMMMFGTMLGITDYSSLTGNKNNVAVPPPATQDPKTADPKNVPPPSSSTSTTPDMFSIDYLMQLMNGGGGNYNNIKIDPAKVDHAKIDPTKVDLTKVVTTTADIKGVTKNTAEYTNSSGKLGRRANMTLNDIKADIQAIIKGSGEAITLSDADLQKIAESIDDASKDANMDQKILAGAIMAESRFKIGTPGTDNLGSVGLLQVIPETSKQVGVDPASRADPRADVIAGARYFAWLSNKYNGNLTYVLDAYNGGPNNDPPRQNPAAQVDYDVVVKRWANLAGAGV